MGRELKRVALDFDWPIREAWPGYLNPFVPAECPPCDGTGYSPMAKLFHGQWYGYVHFDPVAYGAKPIQIDDPDLIAHARRNVERDPSFFGEFQMEVKVEVARLYTLFGRQWCHHLIQADVDALWEAKRLQFRFKEKPTADEVNAAELLGMGHDSINAWVCLEARCAREGVPVQCAKCEGSGQRWAFPALKAAHDAWTKTEPPAGEGYQLWETTSEGSPASPVFKTLDELCAWCEENATTFADQRTTAARWKQMLGGDDGPVRHEEGNMVFI